VSRAIVVRIVCIVASAAASSGCGGSVQSEQPSGDSGATFDAGDSVVDVVVDAGGDSAACDAQATSLASSFVGRTCTLVVRSDVSTGAIRQWSATCGDPKAATTEAGARAAYAPYVAAYTTIDQYTVVPAAIDEWILYRSPGDFGGLGVVSFARSDVVFAADLAWMGPTTVKLPAKWRSSDELTARCDPFTLPSGRYLSADGSPIDTEKGGLALTALSVSPLPRAITDAGHALVNFLATKLPNGGDGTAVADEWLIFVNSGLLD
jgi:hypothetical protein